VSTSIQNKSQKITIYLVFDDSQNRGEQMGAPTEMKLIAASASYTLIPSICGATSAPKKQKYRLQRFLRASPGMPASAGLLGLPVGILPAP
jgi:hypothetical protein